MDLKRAKTQSWTATSPSTSASGNKSPDSKTADLQDVISPRKAFGSPRLAQDRSLPRSSSGGMETTTLKPSPSPLPIESTENEGNKGDPPRLGTVIVSRRPAKARQIGNEPLSKSNPPKRPSEKAVPSQLQSPNISRQSTAERLQSQVEKSSAVDENPSDQKTPTTASSPFEEELTIDNKNLSNLEFSGAPTTTLPPNEKIPTTKQNPDETPQKESQTAKDRLTTRGQKTLQHQNMRVALIAPLSPQGLAEKIAGVAGEMDVEFRETRVLRTFFHALGGYSDHLKTDALSERLFKLKNDERPEYLRALFSNLSRYLPNNGPENAEQKWDLSQYVASITFYDTDSDKSERDKAIAKYKNELGKKLGLIQGED